MSFRKDTAGLADTDAALRRGNGLAGIKERVWAFGGDLTLTPAQPGAARPGLVLGASLGATGLFEWLGARNSLGRAALSPALLAAATRAAARRG